MCLNNGLEFLANMLIFILYYIILKKKSEGYKWEMQIILSVIHREKFVGLKMNSFNKDSRNQVQKDYT